MPEPAVLYLDTENAPNLGYIWGKWEQNVIETKTNWYFLSFAFKWQGSKAIQCCALPDFPAFKKNKECDRPLVKKLWEVLDAADVVIAHNGDRHDLRKAAARFAVHGLKPPAPYKTVDTLKLARKFFQFDSNRLDDLGQYLGVGRKLPHTGKHLWFGCMAGDPAAWKTMRRYNCQDVALLERVYLKLRPWATNHPNLSHISRADACPVCQSSDIKRSGWNYVATGRKQRSTCCDCGHRFVNGKIERL